MEDIDDVMLITGRDFQDMQRMGRSAGLTRHFNLYSGVGFSILLGCNWEFALITLTYTIGNGGTAGMIWMSVAVVVGMGFVIMSMAEAASMAPSSGAQYVWVSFFAPRSCQRYLSYITGCLSITGWQACVSLVSIIGGQQFANIISLVHPEYVALPWHELLRSLSAILVAAVANIFLVRSLQVIEGILIVIHVLAFFFIVVILWVMGPRTSARSAVTDTINAEGWPNTFLACLVSMSWIVATMLGGDAAVHVAEEMREATYNVPRTMLINSALGYSCALIMVITIMFNLGDGWESSTNDLSYVQILLNATGSSTITIVCVTLVACLACACGINQMLTAGRQLWAFARDEGLPLSTWLIKIDEKRKLPLNATYGTLVWAVVSVAVAAYEPVVGIILNGLCITLLLVVYLACILAVFYRKLTTHDPIAASKVRFGRKIGLFINAIAIAFLVIAIAASCFPVAPAPNLAATNWAPLTTGGLIMICTVYYRLRGRHTYISPLERARKYD